MSKKPIIVFEGIEGSGKSHHISIVSRYLSKKKINHIKIREPGGNFELSFDLAFFELNPLPTAINLLPFLIIDEANEYFSTAKYPVLIPSAPRFVFI